MNELIEKIARSLCLQGGNDEIIIFSPDVKRYGPIAMGLRSKYEDGARSIVRTIESEGYRLVRTDPTEEMIDAADNAEYHSSEGINISGVIGRDGIRSMLMAAVNTVLNENRPGQP